MKTNKIVLFLVFITQFAFSQSEKLIHGKIVVKDAVPQGIHIINLVSQKETVSDAKGEFAIMAKPDDLLVFSAINFDYQRKIIETEDYNSPLIIIQMTSKITQLDEVVVNNYSRINAVSLGILQKPAKSYTPAERRLKTATALDASANVGTMMGGAIGLDPLLNWMSGRTKMLKAELKVEKHEILLAQLNDLYEDDYYVDHLKINKDYIKAFKYYIIEDEKFASALRSKNKTLASFLITGLAVEFNKINNENK